MAVIAIRLFLVYVFLTLIVRFMGKRQIGELQVSELIVTFILSELAAAPITDTSVPLLYSLFPILLLAVFEIITSYAYLCLPGLARLASGAPQAIIRGGVIDRRALRACRMTLSELMGELRLQGTPNPGDVAWALLEENGRLSVSPYKRSQSAAQTQSGDCEEDGICHVLIADGKPDEAGFLRAGVSEKQIRRYLQKHGVRSPGDVFLLGVNDAGTWFLQKKNGERD